MRRNLGRARGAAAVVAAAALVLMGSSPATAHEHGSHARGLVGSLDRQVASLTGLDSPDGATPSTSAAPTPSDDSDLPGHETADPAGPDHGGTALAGADLAGQDVADAGDNRATTRDDDSTRADSTLLALGGQEIIGAHADSRKNGESHAGDPLAPLCEASQGQVCLRLLYADAAAQDDGSTSRSRSDNGVADLCLGGSDTDQQKACDGPASVGVADSRAGSDRDQASGRTTASSQSHLAEVCLKQDPGADGCDAGLGVLHSEGQADSGGAKPSASRDSYLLDLSANGEDQGRIDQPGQIAVQPECATPSLVCVDYNQGETYLGDRLAGHAQDGLDVRVLPGTPLALSAGAARTETLVHNDGRAAAPEVLGTAATRGGANQGGLASVLPNTGGVWSGLLAAGLGAVGVGALLMAASRRRALAG